MDLLQVPIHHRIHPTHPALSLAKVPIRQRLYPATFPAAKAKARAFEAEPAEAFMEDVVELVLETSEVMSAPQLQTYPKNRYFRVQQSCNRFYFRTCQTRLRGTAWSGLDSHRLMGSRTTTLI